MVVEKKDYYMTTYTGTAYSLDEIETVGELKKCLEKIISELPEDKKAKLDEGTIKIEYTLHEGIDQGTEEKINEDMDVWTKD